MANGPLGGFMPTPPSPGQPPQVKLETSAESRGNFNKFLGSLPKSQALAPIQTGVMQSSMPPVSPMTDNVNIFQPQMSQMGPMGPMPIMPPTQPVQMMQQGGNVPPRQADIMGEPHMLAYITPQEGGILKSLGGAGKPGPMGIPSFYDDSAGADSPAGEAAGDTGPSESNGDVNEDTSDSYGANMGLSDAEVSGAVAGGGSQESIVGDDPVAGFDFSPGPGVGGGSFDVVSTAPSTPSEQAYNQFKARTGRTSYNPHPDSFFSRTFGIENVDYTDQYGGQQGVESLNQMAFSQSPEAQGLSGMASTTSSVDSTGAGVTPSVNVAAVNVPSTYSPGAFGLGNIVDDPFGLGVVTGFGPVTDAMVSGMYGATANPQAGTQVAGPGFGGFNVPSVSLAPDAMPVGRPDNLTSISKGIDVTNPAEMKGLEDAIRDSVQVSLTMDDIDINTPAGRQAENIETAAMMSDVLSGRTDAPYGIGQPVDVTTGLDVASLAPSTTVEPEAFDMFGNKMSELTGQPGVSVSNQAMQQQVDDSLAQASLDARGDLDSINYSALSPDTVAPSDFTGLMSSRDVAPAATTTATTQQIDPFDIQPTFQNIGLPGATVSTVTPGRTTLGQQQAQALAGLVGKGTPTLSDLLSQNVLADRGRALGPTTFSPDVETMAGRVGPVDTVMDIDTRTPGQQPTVDTVFDIDTRTPGPVDTVFDIDTRTPGPVDTVFDIDTTTTPTVDTSPPPPGFEEQVGKPYSGTPINQIEALVSRPTTADLLGVPPGMINSLLSFVERTARDKVAADLISGRFEPIYDRDGNITGSRNPRTGEVQSGVDMNAPPEVNEESDPPAERVIPKPKDDEVDDDTNIGSIGQIASRQLDQLPTVVESPFDTRVRDFRPVGFDAGNLNKLIERITGVKSPRQARTGGVDSAVDRFLSRVA